MIKHSGRPATHRFRTNRGGTLSRGGSWRIVCRTNRDAGNQNVLEAQGGNDTLYTNGTTNNAFGGAGDDALLASGTGGTTDGGDGTDACDHLTPSTGIAFQNCQTCKQNGNTTQC